MSIPEKTLHNDLRIDLSRQLAAVVGAQPFHCAINAWRALVEFPDLFRDGGKLVEGWFVIETDDRVVLNEHVWCELADERIVDPSILLVVEETTPVCYFPGLTRTWEETEALEGELFPRVRFDGVHGADGLGHPGYKAAREAARKKVYALAMRTHPPKAMQFLTAQDLDEVIGERTNEGAVSDGKTDETVKPPLVNGEPLNIHLSLETASYVQTQQLRCWYNAREALMRMPQAFLTCEYVEGWLVGQWADAIRLTEHGWIATPRTGIVDPTIVLGTIPERLEYVPGLRLSWLQLQTSTACLLPLARRSSGEELQGYREACQIALDKGEQLAWQTGLPLLTEPGAVTTFRRRGPAVLTVEEVVWEFPVPSSPSAQASALLQAMERGAEWQ